ncbi:general secretion pathway protein GspB [Pseudoalteromonas sp. BZB3]|uniref:general secretion pathway protein GspB n=1 Tax=Pseudoalteromonas sp. BZB3 TaxID=3136670 RepID=UPI0032C4AE10
MSIIDAAFKQSQTANNTEQAHLAYQQTKQLAFYRKLSIGLAGVGLSVTFALAGFYSGQYLQSQSQSIATLQNQQEQVEEVTETLAQQDNVSRLQPTQAKPTSETSINQGAVQSGEQYQWMSVQVGVNEQGAPIFKQQLVPLSAVAQVNTVPAESSVVSNTALPEQPEEDLSQYRVLGKPLDDTQLNSQVGTSLQTTPSQEDLSQYRVLGKPLESEPEIQTELLNNYDSQSNTENQIPENAVEEATDEAAERLKAAFELAVAETADKDFTEAEPAETTPEKERLSIEFLPAKTQAAIGKLTYQAHIYATSEHKRWIKINGVELYEGDKINGMRLLEIAPEASVFRFQGYDFAVKAMQDWQPY